MFKHKSFARAAVIFAALAFGSTAFAQDNRVVNTTPAAISSIPMPTSTLPTVNRLIADILRAESANNANDLVLAYGNSVREPQLAKGALSALLYDYYRLRALAGSAMQASQAVDETSLRFSIFQAAQNQVQVQQGQQTLEQNQRIIAQNDTIIRQNARVISLLEQLVRKQ